MLQYILHNPYRILGVYSNSPKKDQLANKGKMQRFLQVKKSMSFPLDLEFKLGQLNRTQSLVDEAESKLALADDQIKYALFWFVNITSIDNIAFNHLLAGNIDGAIEIWKKVRSMSSLQNLFVCYCVKEDYCKAISYAIPLCRDFFADFTKAISENANTSAMSLMHSIVDVLADGNIDLMYIYSTISDSNWKEYIISKRISPMISLIESAISLAQKQRKKGPTESLEAGVKLMNSQKGQIEELSKALRNSDTRYQIIADKLAQEVLQCGINYYNDTDDYDSPRKVISLFRYAVKIAVGSIAKERCKSNLETIQTAFDNLPPSDVMEEDRQIRENLRILATLPQTSEKGLWLIERCQKPLISIKEKQGKSDYYLEISSTIGNAALSNVIAEVNEAQKKPSQSNSSPFEYYSFLHDRFGFLVNLKQALHSAWKTILYIDLLDKTKEFQNNRYSTNRKTLYDIINGVKGFSEYDDNNVLTGCCAKIEVDTRFLWCETDYFQNSSSRADFERYLNKFPNGKYKVEATKKLEEIKEHEKKMRNIFLIVLLVVVALICIIGFANSKTRTSTNVNTPVIEQTTLDAPLTTPQTYGPESYDSFNSYDDMDENSSDYEGEYQQNDDSDYEEDYQQSDDSDYEDYSDNVDDY